MLKVFLLTACTLPLAAYATCWNEAAAAYNVDPLLLKAISWKESRARPAAVGPLLPDNNRALGHMQINTIHLPELRKRGINREDLFDPCISIKVGAWVLSDCIKKFGQTWKSVGCYYAGPGSKNTAAQVEYVADVRRYYEGYQRQEAARRPVAIAVNEVQ